MKPNEDKVVKNGICSLIIALSSQKISLKPIEKSGAAYIRNELKDSCGNDFRYAEALKAAEQIDGNHVDFTLTPTEAQDF